MTWWDGNKKLASQHVQELTAFRAEAEAVLAVPNGDSRPTCSLPDRAGRPVDRTPRLSHLAGR